jgi:hypothetical protein
MEIEEVQMDKQYPEKMTRREVLARAAIGLAGVALSPLLPHLRRQMKKDEFFKNVSNKESSYYRKLAG